MYPHGYPPPQSSDRWSNPDHRRVVVRRRYFVIARIAAGAIGILFGLAAVGGAFSDEGSAGATVLLLALAVPALYFAFFRPARMRHWRSAHPNRPLPTRRRLAWAGGIAALVIASIGVDATLHPEEYSSNEVASVTRTAPRLPSTLDPAAGAVTTSTAPATTESELPVAHAFEIVDTPREAAASLTRLNALPIRAIAPRAGFDPALFGSAWTDDVAVADGHNGCDTRNDILRRDLTEVKIKPGSHGCAVDAGILFDPYTATTSTFTPDGDATSSTGVELDSVVALLDAWQKGAQQLTPDQLRNFANDPTNLQTTDSESIRAKNAGDAAAWLPSNADYRCTYVTRQIDVKTTYHLWVSQNEHDAIEQILISCGAIPVAIETTARVTSTVTPTAVAPTLAAPALQEPLATDPPALPTTPIQRLEVEPGTGYGECGEGYYENSAGNCIPSPGSSPDGATAQCNDGTYSYSQSRRGTCSHHGGVAEWL